MPLTFHLGSQFHTSNNILACAPYYRNYQSSNSFACLGENKQPQRHMKYNSSGSTQTTFIHNFRGVWEPINERGNPFL